MWQELVLTIDWQLWELITKKDKLMQERNKIKGQLLWLIEFFWSINKSDLNSWVEEIKNKYWEQIADNFSMCKQNAVKYVTEYTQNRRALDKIYWEIRKKIFDNIHQILEWKSRKDEKKVKDYLWIPEDLDLFALEWIDIKDKPWVWPWIYDNLKVEVIKDYLVQTWRELGKKYLFSRFFETFWINDLKRILEVCWDDWDKMIAERMIKTILSIPNTVNFNKAIHWIDWVNIDDAVKIISKIKAENDILTMNSKILLFELLICEISKKPIINFIENNNEEFVHISMELLKEIIWLDVNLSISNLIFYKKGTTNKITNNVDEYLSNTKSKTWKRLIIECLINELNSDEIINLFRSNKLKDDDMELLKEHLWIPKSENIKHLLSDEFIINTDKKEKLKLLKKFTRFMWRLLLGKMIFKWLTLKDCFELVSESWDKEEDKKLLKLVKWIPDSPDILNTEFAWLWEMGWINRGSEMTSKEINEKCDLLANTTEISTREEIFYIFLKDALFWENSSITYWTFLDKLFTNWCISSQSIEFLRDKAFKNLVSNADPENIELISKKYFEYTWWKRLKIHTVKNHPFLLKLLYCDHTILKAIFEKVKFDKLTDFRSNNEFLELIKKDEDPDRLDIFRRRIWIILEVFNDDLTLTKIKRLKFWETLEKMNEWFIELLSKKHWERNIYSEVIIWEIESLIDIKVKYDLIHDTDERKELKKEQLERTSSDIIREMSFWNLDADLLSDRLVSRTFIEWDSFIFALLAIRDILNIQYDINVKQSLDEDTKKEKMKDSLIITNIRHIAEMWQEIFYIKNINKRSLIDILLLSRIDDTKTAIRKAIQEDKRRKNNE